MKPRTRIEETASEVAAGLRKEAHVNSRYLEDKAYDYILAALRTTRQEALQDAMLADALAEPKGALAWEWHKVTDGLPLTELPVLVTLANHVWAAARWSFERLWFETDDNESIPFVDEGPEQVTHWATVPSPQEVERAAHPEPTQQYAIISYEHGAPGVELIGTATVRKVTR